ncbi:hypothetical protein BCR44DRAFT_1424130 [Catenaria anguillulae PL171]|uniref:Uncharacterized protein n=1 Tax=Catenaria anguillulae PL171 TaxID=765915 RepID=A0A1Y2I417_9FUNG|nr:hypothetical protein BCR44DRAFT_1424130 [Catenaria anguillulae PL171]
MLSTRRNQHGTFPSTMRSATKARTVAVLVSMGVLAFVLVLLPAANGLPAAAAPVRLPARAGRYNRRIPSMQQQQQPNPQNPLGLPSDIAFDGNGSPSPADASSGSKAASTAKAKANALSLVLYPKQYFAGSPTHIELDPVLPGLASESASSPATDSKAPPPTVRHSACITLSDPLHVVHSAKLIDATHSAKLYAQPGCMADDAGFILDPSTGRPVKADGATLSLTASGHYLTLRKGRGFSGPLRSVRLCSEKEREKCH